MPRTDDDLSPIAPLRQPVFRMLWITWLMANVCMWMSDVAAAWMMTSLTTTPIWVALVQTASTLPVFLLGLPSGALADGLDRKRFFLFTQLWVAVVASILSAFIFLGAMTPALLLALTFFNGIGMAMRWPVFSAIVPTIVPRNQLPAALALNLAILWLAAICFRGVRERRRNRAYPALGVAATLLVGLHAMVDFSLQIPAVAVLYAFMMGPAVAQSAPSSKRKAQRPAEASAASAPAAGGL